MSGIELSYAWFAVVYLDASVFTQKQGPVANGLSRALLLPAGNGCVVSREQKIRSQVYFLYD